MRADILSVAIAAVAMATETRTGENTAGILDLLLEPLPDDREVEFVHLLLVYQHQHDQYGIEALQRSGLKLARLACGLDR